MHDTVTETVNKKKTELQVNRADRCKPLDPEKVVLHNKTLQRRNVLHSCLAHHMV